MSVARLLQQMYGGDIVINDQKDHVSLELNGVFYDINGENTTDAGWDDLTDEETLECESWSFFRWNTLKVNECPACEEPIVI